MPTAETSTKVNYCNLKRSICDKADMYPLYWTPSRGGYYYAVHV